MIPGRTYTPKDVVKAAWRRRWWVAVPFIALSAVALAFVMSLTYNYRSIATLQYTPDAASTALVRPAVQASPSDRLSVIGQEMLSRTRLERIIQDLDLYPVMRKATVMENVITQMRNDVTFEASDRDVFTLGYTAKDPALAFTVATRLTALFLEENARNRGDRADAATKVLAAELEDARTKLEEQEKRLEGYRQAHAGELPSQLASNVQELNNTQLQLRQLSESLGRDRDQRLFLMRQLELAQSSEADDLRAGAAPGAPGTADPMGGASAADQLVAAEASLRALELRLTPEHPDVQRAKAQIVTLRQRAASEVAGAGATGPSPAARRRDSRARELQGQIDLLDRQIATRLGDERQLRSRIADYSRRVDSAPSRESEWLTLSRDYDDMKRLYSTLWQQQQNASMAASVERQDIGDRFRVMEPARLPEKPFSPSRRNYLMIGLALALGLSLAIGGLVEYRDSAMRTDHDVVMSLQLPVLATIPVLTRTASGRSR